MDGSTESLTIVGFVQNQTYNHVAAVFTPITEWRKLAFAAPGSDKGVKAPVNAIMLQGDDIQPCYDPNVLADEPTASLDTKRAHEVVSLIAHEVKTRHKAAIMVTHDERLLAYCDKVYRMEDGKLVLATVPVL